MKTQLLQIRCTEQQKKKIKEYAKKHNSDISKITLSIWESILKGAAIRLKHRK